MAQVRPGCPPDAASHVPVPAKILANGVKLGPPMPRFEPGVAVAGARSISSAGSSTTTSTSPKAPRYTIPNPASGVGLPIRPAAVTHAGIAIVGDEVWVAGGFIGHHPGPVTRAVWRYHMPTDQWMTGPLLPEARGSGGLAYLDGQLHYFGGVKSDRHTDSADHWSLTPGPDAVWTPRAPLLTAKNHFGLVVREGMVHLLGGQFGHDNDPKDIDDHQVYHAATDSWRTAAPLARKRSHMEPGSFVHQGKIVVSGGRSNLIPVLHDVSAYDPASDTWTDLPGLPEPMRAPVLRVVGSALFGGLGGVTATGTMPSQLWMKYPASALGLPAAPAER
ncbi:MAG: hypothetical protein IPJ98_09720 [Bryobacterales bacterium]|nr:hypothetical protein [Bryobacterales bacterium]